MKKKGHSTIPDFSRTRPGSAKPSDDPRLKTVAPKPDPVRAGKPQATSAKSGQRGR
jgi:hypothetical protein